MVSERDFLVNWLQSDLFQAICTDSQFDGFQIEKSNGTQLRR